MENINFECPICLDLLANPISLPCGHNFCYSCKKDFSIMGTKKCPVCRRDFPKTNYNENNLIIHLITRFYPKYHYEKIVIKKQGKIFGYFVVVFTVVFAMLFSQRRFREEVLKVAKMLPGCAYHSIIRISAWVISRMLNDL